LPKNLQGWWVLAEPGWLCLFGGRDGNWQHFAAQPVAADWAAALPELIDRETGLFAAPASSSVWVQAVGVGAVEPSASGDIPWQILPHDSEQQGALALAGV
jgi:hypothetical protein